jgi:hypothetical protein
MRDLSSGEHVLGAPAVPEREQKRIYVSLTKLPDLCRDVRRIKEHLGLDEEAKPKPRVQAA